MSRTDLLIWIAGIGGLAIAAFGLVSLLVDAVRRRRPFEAAAAVAVATLVVWFLLAHGEVLLR
jgi:hypothetical protein